MVLLVFFEALYFGHFLSFSTLQLGPPKPILNLFCHLLWFYFVTVSEFSYYAKPYSVSGLTPMPQIPNQLHFIQRSAHEVLGAIWEA